MLPDEAPDNLMSISSVTRQRTTKQLRESYDNLKATIPREWRNEELAPDVVCQEENQVKYLETFGPLALLIFMRS